MLKRKSFKQRPHTGSIDKRNIGIVLNVYCGANRSVCGLQTSGAAPLPHRNSRPHHITFITETYLQRSTVTVWTCADEVVLHRPLLTRTHTRATQHSSAQTPEPMRRLACAAPLQRALARRLAGGPITNPTRNGLPPRRPLSASSNPNPNPSSSSSCEAGAAAAEGGTASGGVGPGGPRPVPPRKGPKVVRCCLLYVLYDVCQRSLRLFHLPPAPIDGLVDRSAEEQEQPLQALHSPRSSK